MPTRRLFVEAGVVASAAEALGGPCLRLQSRKAEATTLDPNSIPADATSLFVLPAMPPTRVLSGPRPMPGDPPDKKYYDICLTTTVQSFNSDGSPYFPITSNPADPYIPSSGIPAYWNSNLPEARLAGERELRCPAPPFRST
jgi:hypothetical protein